MQTIFTAHSKIPESLANYLQYYSSYAYRDNGRILFPMIMIRKNIIISKKSRGRNAIFSDERGSNKVYYQTVPDTSIAAEAGANGKTFSVISWEIRLFVENSTKSNNEIETLITEIQEEISNVVKAMEDGDSSIQEGKLLINNFTKE